MSAINLYFRACCVGVVGVIIAGCEGKRSSAGERYGDVKVPVQTSAMNLHMEVTFVHPDPVRVFAKVSDATTTDNKFALDGGDYLRACVGATCENLVATHNMWGVIIGYRAELPYFPDTPYVVSLIRPSDRVSAFNSSVTLPPSFAIVQPTMGQRVADGGTITVAWQPVSVADQAIVNYRAYCVYANGNNRGSWPDPVVDSGHTGVVNFAVDDVLVPLRIPQPPAYPASPFSFCDFMFDVSEERTGTIDSAWGGGTATSILNDYAPIVRYEPSS